jgi:hypothetical protein
MKSSYKIEASAPANFAKQSSKYQAADFFEMAFGKNSCRTPRSVEYKKGMIALMEYRMMEKVNCVCPYKDGTCEADAFHAGMEEGWWYINNFKCDARKGS